MRRVHWTGFLTLAVLGAAAKVQGQGPVGPAFTVQGRLTVDGSPANGAFDFKFDLYSQPGGGSPLNDPVLEDNLAVTDGLFTALLDFGYQFQGSARFVEIGVRPGDSTGAYTTLSPRQELTAVPYAVHALGLGTADARALDVTVNGARALRLEPNATSPNLIGGFGQNGVTVGVKGAAIGGGGNSQGVNVVFGDYGTIGGGLGNLAGDAPGGTDDHNFDAAVLGGSYNWASGNYSAIVGGAGNRASGGASMVGGGESNIAENDLTTVGGGDRNVARGFISTIGGGSQNQTSGSFAGIGGGASNTASGSDSTVGGGHSNTASGSDSTVGGGDGNRASGEASTVPGGSVNTAAGKYSLAAGRHAKANHAGSFVWADSTDADFASSGNDQFSIRAAGGVRLASNAGPARTIGAGDLYRDNATAAWAKVAANGSVGSEFGVSSVSHVATGNYAITLDASAVDSSSLIPVANAEIDNPPSSADTIRIVSINQTGANTFSVYVNKGTGALVDNDFVFLVTAR